ncbi:MAG: ABC transporter substrate-binding protein [Acidisphaera sp.]|nr:ABC transporter substrate-binding protein [Acidisphaera sp.]
MSRKAMLCLIAALACGPAAHAQQAAPAEIKIGHVHAASGAYASISMPVYDGLKLWIDQQNAGGGAMVKPFGKKIPLKLISYDDQSNPGTAATLINQLITQDKVDILVADSGSVLTAVAVPIAREHKMLLFNPTGTGAPFFTKDNPYIALLADPASTIWPKYLAGFLTTDGVKDGLKRLAILYATNDFTTTQANALRGFVKQSGAAIDIVYDQGVPTNTSNYGVLINNIAAAKPDAVVELGYVGNDIAFLRNLQDAGQKFKFLFALYPGVETDEVLKNVGAQAMDHVFTYVTSQAIEYKPNVGMTLDQFREAFEKSYKGQGVEFGFNAIAGYHSGLMIGQALADTDSLQQLDLRRALFAQSGKVTTLDGTFELDDTGAQIGEITPLGQIIADPKGAVRNVVVFPHELAAGKPLYE